MTRDALWLVGADIARSLSPAMHNAALEELGEPLRYSLRPTTADALDATLAAALVACRGINVTAPFKREVYLRCREVADEDAAAAGAVNTVIYDDGGPLSAHNTDIHGLRTAWRRAAVSIADRPVVVVGAGGAARAVVVAAARERAGALTVVARRPAAAEELYEVATGQGLTAAARDADDPPHLAVFATPHVDDPTAMVARALPHPGVVHDLRVRPDPALRNAALRLGHLYLDGTSMLLAQGVRALELFLGARDVASGPVLAAMNAALARRGPAAGT